jgi:hypothetical protein
MDLIRSQNEMSTIVIPTEVVGAATGAAVSNPTISLLAVLCIYDFDPLRDMW